jgi:4-hydroxybenzoate polyprenyltransferase
MQRRSDGDRLPSDRRPPVDGDVPTDPISNGSASGEPLAGASDWVPNASPIRELTRSLRLHQCVKNLIIFVPVILGGRLTDLAEVIYTVVAFIALTCIASGTYLINDIWDVAEDRKHWSKRYRPIAAGRLAVTTALCVAVVCICVGVALGFLVSSKTGAMLLLYLGITLAYTLHLKTVAFVDGLVLATLFTVRLGIGAAAADVPPSPWLFVFSMFLFASLSYAKRHTEIVKAIARQENAMNGRGYRLIDGPMVLTVGLSTGIGAVMIMVLYIVEEAFRNSFYGSTGWLWGFPPLVFLFVVRVWLLSARGEMSDDPVAFAIKDRTSIALAALLMLCFGFAWLG